MKVGWQIKPLGEFCDILDNLRKPITKSVRTQGIYPYYGATGILDYVEGFLFDEALVLVGEDGAKWASGQNTAFPVIGKCWVNNHAHVLRPHRDKVIDKWLINYLVHSDLSEFVSGLTVPKLNQGNLRVIPIPIPSVQEQQRIVAILDQAFEGIAKARANAEQNLQNARALFESHLQSVFSVRPELVEGRGEGWMKNKLGSLTTKIGSGATPRGGGESYKAEGISLVRSLNVHDFGFKYAKLAFLDDAQAKELSNVELKSNDVLLNITGASVARCCIVPEDVLPARVNQHVSIIRPIAEKLDSSFLHYLLLSKPYKDKLLQTGSEGGSTRQAITKAQIQEFLIEYPPAIEDQKAIAHKLNEMLKETQRLETLYQRKIALLDELKKSLLQQAFAGEL